MASVALVGRGLRFQEEALWLVPLTLMSVGMLMVAQIVGFPFGLSPWSMLSSYASKALKALPVIVGVAIVVQLALSARAAPRKPLSEFLVRIRQLFADPWLVAARIGPLLLMPIVFVAFSSLKMLMPRFVRFWLDDSFAAIDRALFLGRQPWELTHALLGSTEATLVIDRLYTLWILFLSIAIVTVALFGRRADRARFFMAFALGWILLGVGGAWLGSSAGPCFAEQIGAASAPEFRGLVERLQSISIATHGSLGASSWQQVLWRAHSTETYSFGMGISAMPSLHNAVATLYALAAFRVGRLLGWSMTGYAVLIFVGSVHLGWHYAVDGLIGATAMALIWRWVDRWCRRCGYDEAVAGSTRGEVTGPLASAGYLAPSADCPGDRT